MRGVARIERGDRLVGEQDLRLLHERAGDRDALLLPAGERVRAVQAMRDHVEALQRLDRKRAVLRGEHHEQRGAGSAW